MNYEMTETSTAALLWVLWHHQGASSNVGQPIRFVLGMGKYDRLTESQIAQAKTWGEFIKTNTEVVRREASERTQSYALTGAKGNQ